MSISGIQSGIGSQFDIYSSQKRAQDTLEGLVTRNSGPDTVFISDQARAMAGAQDAGEASEESFLQANRELLQSDDDAQKATRSLKTQGVNLFSLMLDSLFLAELEDGEEAAAAAETGEPVKSRSVMEEGGKAADLKKVVNDVMTGKADISDLPAAMAGKPGSGAADKSAARTKSESAEDKA